MLLHYSPLVNLDGWVIYMLWITKYCSVGAKPRNVKAKDEANKQNHLSPERATRQRINKFSPKHIVHQIQYCML